MIKCEKKNTCSRDEKWPSSTKSFFATRGLLHHAVCSDSSSSEISWTRKV